MTSVPSLSPISWPLLARQLKDSWAPGQHFSIIGPTGWGKSYLATRGLLPLWTHTIILDVKGDDDTLRSAGHRTSRRYPSRWELYAAGRDTQRWRIALGPFDRGRRTGWDQVFREIWASGRSDAATWVIYADETRLLTDPRYLGLGPHLDAIWISGRSRGITLIAGTQAPRYVPSSMYDQPRYFAIGRLRDRRALRRLAEIGGDTDLIMEVVPTLAEREWLFIGPGLAEISKVTSARS